MLRLKNKRLIIKISASHNTVHGGKMGLWMLLLLHLHLGNAPWIEVVCVSLPAPSNVSISSFNMEHTLSFLPGPETPTSTNFTVEILRLRRNRSWKPVAGCSELTAGQTCNLTQAFKDPFDHYQARVQAFTPNRTSNWTMSGWFQPLTDTMLGPPDVSVSGCGNCLILKVRVPPTRGLQLHEELVFHVQRTRDGAQFKLNLHYQEEITISYLQPGVEYCVTVTVKARLNSNAVPSKSHCAFTSPPQPSSSSLHVVFGLLGAFCALGFLLIGLVVYGSQLSFKLRRRLFPRTLSYFLLQSHNHGNASPECSGHISAMQLHKEGSADSLLTVHRHVEPLRSSSEEGEENFL
ncbi:interferon alpha/beta receptor 2 isoform X2 [Larimichthys crocea]|uniref:interferon alpha/beta receptor 2 isoform X2 n=1 Tax=Larimichthys crocea TaxID=215358 RepID=UPI000F5E02E6|nr:interferon alpha/beta receptor 2 isoform X2 [Larimichthys crocea]UYQ90451.1 cytokine receptor family B3 [Larimichthys crocea]